MYTRKLLLVCVTLLSIAAKPPLPAAKRVDLDGDPLPNGAVLRLGTLQRRTGSANHLAVSADGKSIIGLRYGTNLQGRNVASVYLSVWDSATGALRQSRALSEELSAYHALSSDGRLLLMPDATVWNLSSGKPIRTLHIDNKDWPYCAVFSPDCKQVAAVLERGEENIVAVWNLASGKRIFTRKINNQVFGSQLIFSPDGKRLLVPLTAHEGGMRCWDVASGRLLWENKELNSYSMVITPDGKVLSAQAKVSAVDLATGRTIAYKHLPPLGWTKRLTLTPDGRTLLVADSNGVQDVLVWDLLKGKAVWTLKRAGDMVVVAADGKSVFTSNGALQRWDLATGKPCYADTFVCGHVRDVVALAFSAKGTRLASTSADGTVRLWDTASGHPLRVWRGHQGLRPSANAIPPFSDGKAGSQAVDITSDGQRVLSGGRDECLRLWEAATDKEVRSIVLPQRQEGEPERCFHCLRISPDGGRAVALFGSRHLYQISSFHGLESKNHIAIWDLKTGKMQSCHPLQTTWYASNSAISPDGCTLVVDGDLLDAASGQKIGRLKGAKSGDSCIFSRDGAVVVGCAMRIGERSSSPDGVRVWETASGQTIAHLYAKSSRRGRRTARSRTVAHRNVESWIHGLSFHPGNPLVAANGADGIRLWDVRSGAVVARLKKQESLPGSEPLYSYASCLAFAPDGQRLATGHADSTILVWDISLSPRAGEPLAADQIESLWTDLAAADAATAWRAVWRLADAPNAVLPLLRARLKPAPIVPVQAMRKIVMDLDDDSFPRREAAVKRLTELRREAEPALRAALKAKPSLEQRRRIEELLAALPVVPPPPTRDELRQLRALIVLERIGSPEARRLLEEPAKGPQSARLTRQARAALECLR
jgi:WD40 repeat protein